MLELSLHTWGMLYLKAIGRKPDNTMSLWCFGVLGESRLNKQTTWPYPRGIRVEKSSKDMASSRNLVSTIGALASPKTGDGTRCPEW